MTKQDIEAKANQLDQKLLVLDGRKDAMEIIIDFLTTEAHAAERETAERIFNELEEKVMMRHFDVVKFWKDDLLALRSKYIPESEGLKQ